MHLDDACLWITQYLERRRVATGDELVANLRREIGGDPMTARVLLDEMVSDRRLDQRIEAVEATDGHADLRYVTWFSLAVRDAVG